MSFPTSLSPASGTPLPGDGSGTDTLDAAGAIALMDDSLELYQEIAQAYLQELAELGPRLDDLLGQTHLAEATRTLHTFKGLSLTVGAKLLSEVCRQCELQLKSVQHGQALDAASRAAMQDRLQRALAQTQVALQAALSRMDPAAAPTLAPASVGAADTTALLADLRGLQLLLARSDMQALDMLAGLLQRHADQQVLLQGLQQAVKSFNFSQAVVQCDELIRTLGDTTR